MTYEEKKKLIEAEKVLKNACEKTDCTEVCDRRNCLFFSEVHMKNCKFHGTPNTWYIPPLLRWTHEDVALAKALKAVGVEWIARDFKGDIALLKNGVQLGEIVKITNVFADLKEDGKEFIDTIIKEAEG